jgi:hypothetical protein
VAIEAGQYLHAYQFIAMLHLFETEYDLHSLETSGKHKELVMNKHYVEVFSF